MVTSAGYQLRCEPVLNFAQLPRSPAVKSGQLNLSGDVGKSPRQRPRNRRLNDLPCEVRNRPRTGSTSASCIITIMQAPPSRARTRRMNGTRTACTITVGRTDPERQDLHARFYLNGNCFAPDLSRFQMCELVGFPHAWRKNVPNTRHVAPTFSPPDPPQDKPCRA